MPPGNRHVRVDHLQCQEEAHNHSQEHTSRCRLRTGVLASDYDKQ